MWCTWQEKINEMRNGFGDPHITSAYVNDVCVWQKEVSRDTVSHWRWLWHYRVLLLPFSLLMVAKQHGPGPFRLVSRVNSQRTQTARRSLSWSFVLSLCLAPFVSLSQTCFLFSDNESYHVSPTSFLTCKFCQFVVLGSSLYRGTICYFSFTVG